MLPAPVQLAMLRPLCCAAPCSRCTGYRPILDAFKAFAKADPAAYSEEALAARKAEAAGAPAPAPKKNGGPCFWVPSLQCLGSAQLAGPQCQACHAESFC